MCISTDLEKNSMVLFVNSGENHMQVGDLVKADEALGGHIGVVVSPYDIPKRLWMVFWTSENTESLCHESNVEVINESR